MQHRIASFLVCGALLFAMAAPAVSAQGPRGRGLSALVCLAEQLGFAIGNGNVSVEVDDPGVEPGGIGLAEVTIHHGRSSSTHWVEYEDSNGSGGLDCGDTILSVT